MQLKKDYHTSRSVSSADEEEAIPMSEPSVLGGYPRSHPLNVLLLGLGAIVGAIALLMVIVGIVASWQRVIIAGSLMTTSIIYTIAIAFPLACLVAGAVAMLVITRWHTHKAKVSDLQVRREEEALFALQEERARQTRLLDAEAEMRQAEADRVRAEAERLRIVMPHDDQGNLTLRNPATWEVVQLRGTMREHPNLTSLNYHNVQHGTKITEERSHLPALDMAKPTIEEIVQFVKRNSLESCLGRSKQTGELIPIQLIDAQIKLIGGTRMGKSCEAGAIIDIACKTHDPDHLQIALLDLEYKTSRLFEHDPHVLVMETGYKKVKAHARDVAQVAQYLVYLHNLMLAREKLTEVQLAALPHILIYLEEFLYWKKLLGQFVSPDLRTSALAAFSGIATRGIKYGMHLMACAQVDYADDELKDAMAQFLAINVAFSVKPTAAQAAGFVRSDLLKQNYADRIPGQFVVEQIGGADLGIAPDFDVRAKLEALAQMMEADPQIDRHAEISERAATLPQPYRNPTATLPRNKIEPALQAKLEQMMANPGESMADCLWRIWKVKPSGTSSAYKQAKEEYTHLQEIIHDLARSALREEEPA